MKVVFDSNIFISHLHFSGAISKLFDEIKQNKITVCTSKHIAEEVVNKLRTKFKWSEGNLKEAELLVSTIGLYVESVPSVSIIKTDPVDNNILSCAEYFNVDYIITGDKKHLLPLKKFKNIQILSPRDFLLKVLYKLP